MDTILDSAEAERIERGTAEREIEKRKEQGEVYHPGSDLEILRTL